MVSETRWSPPNKYTRLELPPLYAVAWEIAARLGEEPGPLSLLSNEQLVKIFPPDRSIVIGGLPPESDNEMGHALFRAMHHPDVQRFCMSYHNFECEHNRWSASPSLASSWKEIAAILKKVGVYHVFIHERRVFVTERRMFPGMLDDDLGAQPRTADEDNGSGLKPLKVRHERETAIQYHGR